MSKNIPEVREAIRMDVGSPEWLAYRRTGIGASEVGSVLGVCPWKSPVDVWLEKMGRVPPFEGNNAFQFTRPRGARR